MIALPLLWMLLACGDRLGDAADYPAALAEIATAPADAARICARIDAVALREDCITAGAEALAPTQPDPAAALCATLAPGEGRDECLFQVAERSGDSGRCAAAGVFADDCLMHLWTRALKAAVPKEGAPGDFEAKLAPLAATYGFTDDDMRPWSAAYRTVLSRQIPLDRASCDRAPRPALVECCRQTGLVVYADRLNQLRDHALLRKTAPGTPAFCDGGPLPRRGEFTPDPELTAMLEQRRSKDLCP